MPSKLPSHKRPVVADCGDLSRLWVTRPAGGSRPLWCLRGHSGGGGDDDGDDDDDDDDGDDDDDDDNEHCGYDDCGGYHDGDDDGSGTDDDGDCDDGGGDASESGSGRKVFSDPSIRFDDQLRAATSRSKT